MVSLVTLTALGVLRSGEGKVSRHFRYVIAFAGCVVVGAFCAAGASAERLWLVSENRFHHAANRSQLIGDFSNPGDPGLLVAHHPHPDNEPDEFSFQGGIFRFSLSTGAYTRLTGPQHKCRLGCGRLPDGRIVTLDPTHRGLFDVLDRRGVPQASPTEIPIDGQVTRAHLDSLAVGRRGEVFAVGHPGDDNSDDKAPRVYRIVERDGRWEMRTVAGGKAHAMRDLPTTAPKAGLEIALSRGDIDQMLPSITVTRDGGFLLVDDLDSRIFRATPTKDPNVQGGYVIKQIAQLNDFHIDQERHGPFKASVIAEEDDGNILLGGLVDYSESDYEGAVLRIGPSGDARIVVGGARNEGIGNHIGDWQPHYGGWAGRDFFLETPVHYLVPAPHGGFFVQLTRALVFFGPPKSDEKLFSLYSSAVSLDDSGDRYKLNINPERMTDVVQMLKKTQHLALRTSNRLPLETDEGFAKRQYEAKPKIYSPAGIDGARVFPRVDRAVDTDGRLITDQLPPRIQALPGDIRRYMNGFINYNNSMESWWAIRATFGLNTLSSAFDQNRRTLKEEQEVAARKRGQNNEPKDSQESKRFAGNSEPSANS